MALLFILEFYLLKLALSTIEAFLFFSTVDWIFKNLANSSSSSSSSSLELLFSCSFVIDYWDCYYLSPFVFLFFFALFFSFLSFSSSLLRAESSDKLDSFFSNAKCLPLLMLFACCSRIYLVGVTCIELLFELFGVWRPTLS